MSASRDLSGQVAIVTGASRGIGRAFATGLASAGAHVVAVARSAEGLESVHREIVEKGGQSITFTVDVTDPDAVANLSAKIESNLGNIDLLVNNAGVMGPLGRDWEVDPASWWRTIPCLCPTLPCKSRCDLSAGRRWRWRSCATSGSGWSFRATSICLMCAATV